MKYGLTTLALVLIAGTAWAISNMYVSGEYRYKITVEVETPDGIKTGSAVRAVSDYASSIKNIDLPGSSGPPPKVRGEAVVVDLGEDKQIFGLINWSSYREVYAAFPFSGAKKAGDGLRYYLSLEPGTSAPLPKESWPMFSYFENKNDPKSIKPTHRLDLSKTFGDGYRVNKITITITDEPVTWGLVDQYLPENFQTEVIDKWKKLSKEERRRFYKITRFKEGETQ